MKRKKPKKPYADFPLFAHAREQWAKKIRGKTHYFGTWDDPKAALNKYLKDRDHLQAGKVPRGEGVLTVAGLCNLFLSSKRAKVDAGELSLRTWSDYFTTCEGLVERLGKATAVSDLASVDFAKLRSELAETRGAVALGNEIQRIRTVFRFAFANDHIDRPVKYGDAFAKPSRKIVRKARNDAEPRMLEAKEIASLLAVAKPQLKAMILLGVNCGFGQTDVASLPRTSLDLKRSVVNFPRPKTEIQRRCPLWPETVKALKDVLKDAANTPLVFMTRFGSPWVRIKEHEGKASVVIDSVRLEFKKLLKTCKLARLGLGFYALRHTFRTIADGCKDAPAVDHIMGHHDASVAGMYRERIEDVRLKAVTDAVRKWLFAVTT